MLEEKVSHLESPDYGMIYWKVIVTAPSVNSFKNCLDRHWSTEEFIYNYKAALPGSRRAFQGKVEDLTTEATAYGPFFLTVGYGQVEPK